jgi:ferredoxin
MSRDGERALLPSEKLRVRLEPSGGEIVLAPSERLLDALDAALERAIAARRSGDRSMPSLPALPTACRAANCGACLVQVESGAEAFAPASSAEQSLLERLGAGRGARLGCQLVAGPRTGRDPGWVASVRVVTAPRRIDL